jgi:hypothetical protein
MGGCAGVVTTAEKYRGIVGSWSRLPVYTCNPDDFAGMDGLGVVAVPLADE